MSRRRPSLNLTDQLEHIVWDICTRVPEFAHIDSRRLLLCLARTRRGASRGAFAKIVPMRFPDGTPLKTTKGHCYALPQIPTPHGDILYLIYVYVPRFFEQPFERRLLTLFHELYHIAPAFDGTIRCIGTRAHGASRDRFNTGLQPLMADYLATTPPAETLSLLHADLSTLGREAALVGRVLPMPKILRLS